MKFIRLDILAVSHRQPDGQSCPILRKYFVTRKGGRKRASLLFPFAKARKTDGVSDVGGEPDLFKFYELSIRRGFNIDEETIERYSVLRRKNKTI